MKFKSGTESTRASAVTPDEGEPLWTDDGHLWIGFQSVAGGKFIGPNGMIFAYSTAAQAFSTPTQLTFEKHGADSFHITHSISTNNDEFSPATTGRYAIACQATLDWVSLADQVELYIERWNGSTWGKLVASESWETGIVNDRRSIRTFRNQLLIAGLHKIRFTIQSLTNGAGIQAKAGSLSASIIYLD